MSKRVVLFLSVVFAVYWLYSVRDIDMSPSQISRIPAAALAKAKEFTDNSSTDAPSAPLPSAPARSFEVEKWVGAESAKMGKVDIDPVGTEARLKLIAHQLTDSDLATLKRIALDRTAMADQRFLSVYMLGLSDSESATESLKIITASSIEKPNQDRDYSDELSVRLHALESLMRKLSPNDSIQYLKTLLGASDNPVIARQALIWLKRLG